MRLNYGQFEHADSKVAIDFIGAPAGIRTPNQQIMSLLL